MINNYNQRHNFQSTTSQHRLQQQDPTPYQCTPKSARRTRLRNASTAVRPRWAHHRRTHDRVVVGCKWGTDAVHVDGHLPQRWQHRRVAATRTVHARVSTRLLCRSARVGRAVVARCTRSGTVRCRQRRCVAEAATWTHSTGTADTVRAQWARQQQVLVCHIAGGGARASHCAWGRHKRTDRSLV